MKSHMLISPAAGDPSVSGVKMQQLLKQYTHTHLGHTYTVQKGVVMQMFPL